MERDRWRRLLSVCQEARNRPESEREAFLAQACGDDESLRSEIRSLLRQQIFPESAPGKHPSPAVHSGADDSAALVIGQRLGGYDIKALLGVGGMGEVYRARDLRLGRDVALKLLPSKAATDDDRIARLEREARVLAALNHPNIAAIYGIEESEGVRALVLELVEGETLAERLRTRGALSLDHALAIASQIATALEAAHGRGIIHRDLKPANVQITPDGTVKVLDFGLAKAIAGDPDRLEFSNTPLFAISQRGIIQGTPAYMSPEQARGEEVDQRADIWAFGCVLYEMLTGRAAFARPTMAATFAAIMGSDVDWTCLPDGLPAALTHLLRRCLEQDPNRRIGRMTDARLELERVEASVNAPPHSKPPRPRPRRWWPRVRLTISIGVSIGVAFLALLLWPTRDQRPPVPPLRAGIPTVIERPSEPAFPAPVPPPDTIAGSATGAMPPAPGPTRPIPVPTFPAPAQATPPPGSRGTEWHPEATYRLLATGNGSGSVVWVPGGVLALDPQGSARVRIICLTIACEGNPDAVPVRISIDGLWFALDDSGPIVGNVNSGAAADLELIPVEAGNRRDSNTRYHLRIPLGNAWLVAAADGTLQAGSQREGAVSFRIQPTN